ncbi:DUF6504 family protein [Novosphingopyxis sp. YJ-S2-01]|uniref:DUF6504 family protein n=1 Tax=Novosphingopyxis sp. YJ-S2-01 TaxID=2794021 RepID=UPI0018DDA0ED|nr:DUF6504 family protein [Novosphingopyxis sp. YJ-S2-01]MBH9536398.1 DNA polymerase Y family protein [Novosphingopyxis sp. YJ-S2-01]
MTARQIVSIWLPKLAIERWEKARPDSAAAPTSLVSEGTHGLVIEAVNAAAQDAGVKAGGRFADARAICPELAAQPHDAEGDAALLERLTLWCRRWGPWSALDGADGLLIDTSGAAHLFGGEAAALADMTARIGAAGYSARAAMAPTAAAAWALARYADNPGVHLEDVAATLAPLPVAALRLDGATVLLLKRLGLKTIGDLAAVPREGLVRRFRNRRDPAANPLIRIDQALGRAQEAIPALETEPPQRAFARVAEPILHVSILLPVLEGLSERLSVSLRKRHRGARRLGFEAFRVDGHVARLEAELARPTRDPAHMTKLFTERLEGLEAGFGFDAFALTALWHEALDAAQPDLSGEVADDALLAGMIDRLVVRLGRRNVRVPEPRESHMPERSVRWRSAVDADLASPPRAGPNRTPRQLPLPFHQRPLRLLDSPEPISVLYITPEGVPRRFTWRRAQHEVVRVEGPERIAPEWWREKSTARLRDYYRVEDEAGGRYWIYRNGLVGDGRGGAPDWYLHGLFA